MNNGNTKNPESAISKDKEHKIHKFVKHSVSLEERQSYYSHKYLRRITKYQCACGEMQEIARVLADDNLLFDVFYSETISTASRLNK